MNKKGIKQLSMYNTRIKQDMKKKLSERIAERAKSKQQSRNAKNRAQFLNVRDEIQEPLMKNGQ